ncbi:MAG TPA: alpha-2-macroglobulin family protein, partial [Ferruginibacter sp.]|nr:alpha-2-macroglobulin family protein [Ferruginibacter sp.]
EVRLNGNPASDVNNIDPLSITTQVQNMGMTDKKVELKLYALPDELNRKKEVPFNPVDASIYSKDEIEVAFPEIQFEAAVTSNEKQLIWDTLINTGGTKKIEFPRRFAKAGNFRAKAICVEDGKTVGESHDLNFFLFDINNNLSPKQTFEAEMTSGASAGDTIKLITADMQREIFAIYQVSYFQKTKKGLAKKTEYQTVMQSPGIHQFEFVVPKHAFDQLKIVQLHVADDELFTVRSKEVNIYEPETANPDIQIEQFRSTVVPGASETFSISVKTKNENVAAELLTAMYDASLDKLKKNIWRMQNYDPRGYLGFHWPESINETNSGNNQRIYLGTRRERIRPLWWLNPVDVEINGNWDNPGTQDFNYFRGNQFTGYTGRVAGLEIDRSLAGRAAGVQLNEVVVSVGYGIRKDAKLLLRGSRSISGDNSPLIVIDGTPYVGDISLFNQSLITEIITLSGSEGSALYGSRASSGAILISTKGPVKLPEKTEPEVVVRKNFNETAFFFPQVYADKDGYYKFSFTMPESVTEWRWMMLAHTKAAKFVYKEMSLRSQLMLMVQPNMPRVLYQGDKLLLQSRISNLDSNALSGTISCSAEDAVTGEDISNKIIFSTANNFSIKARSNESSSFEIRIPEDQLNPIKLKVVAHSANFSDGEEHIIPVLSKRVFVTRSTSFQFERSNDTTIDLQALPADATSFGVGINITPNSTAALVNSIAYLANYSYDCAEQTFNKMLAHAIALKLMRSDSTLQYAYNQIMHLPQSGKKESLPDELAEATMPWLNLDNKTTKLQGQLRTLLDTFETKKKITQYLKTLNGLQNRDGGMAWFQGGASDHYISNYILKSYANAESQHLLNSGTNEDWGNYYRIPVDNLIDYCDSQFDRKTDTTNIDLDYLYGRSYYVSTNQLGALASKFDQSIKHELNRISELSLLGQAKLLLTMLQYYPKVDIMYNNALQQLGSIQQL